MFYQRSVSTQQNTSEFNWVHEYSHANLTPYSTDLTAPISKELRPRCITMLIAM